MVTLEPIWRDPQADISAMSAAREVKGYKKELRERPAGKSDSKPQTKNRNKGFSVDQMSKTHTGMELNKTST